MTIASKDRGAFTAMLGGEGKRQKVKCENIELLH